MELIVKEKTENSLLLIFKGVDLGFLYLLSRELLEDKNVANAWAKKPHLLIDEVEFYVATNEGDPLKIVEAKINEIQNKFLKLKKDVEKIAKV
jgi:DNA-directed RNA polymerase subunit L